MNFVSEYIKYLFKAQGRHGIHSPFVFDFVDKCIKVGLNQKYSDDLNSLKKHLLNDKTSVHIVDAGAGSKKMGNVRSVQSIFKTASCKGVYAKLLSQISTFYQPSQILELGTSLGLGTIALSHGNAAGIVSVDACANTLAVAADNLEKMHISNQVTLVNATFTAYLNNLDNVKFDLIYIDGHHDGNALREYMERLSNFAHQDTMFILDDIRWSDGMFEVWNELIASEKYHLSMDLFRMGILIPRPQQVKQHFVIKLKNVLSGF